MIARAALEEDVDAVGLSILSGAHNVLLPKVLGLLRAQGGESIVVFAGGIIPAEDIADLKTMGISEVFTPGTSSTAIVDWIRANVRPRA